ncbi:MAG TPA: hypothetical protein VHD62_13610 [Opitutaceae bacterium]|nr:hypothetical protein [Opitutaceae bacterium]
MSDRLNELRRQRALMQEHLAWLDSEIATAEKSSGEATVAAVSPAPSPAPAPVLRTTPRVVSLTPVATPRATTAVSAPAPADPLAEKILEEYRVPEKSLREDVRRGCFLYFAGALLVLGGVVVALYFLLHGS